MNPRGSKHDRIGDEMATTRYGQLQEFDVENESITAYLERAELYFQANDVADEKQVAVLLSNIGAKTYGLLRNLVAPKAPEEKTFAEITSLLKSHFEPTPSVIAERYRFHRRDQASGESIVNYVAELRKLTTHCKFEETKDFLQESLRDRFVCGLRSESIRKCLLTEDQKLTFAKARRPFVTNAEKRDTSNECVGVAHNLKEEERKE